MSKGSSIDRVINFFRDSSIDTMRVTFALVKEVVESRLASAKKAGASQATAASTPRRKRRTKAQIAEDNASKQMSISEGAKAAGAQGSITI